MAVQKGLRALYHSLHGGVHQQLEMHQRLVDRGWLSAAPPSFVAYNRYRSHFIKKRFPAARVELHPTWVDLFLPSRSEEEGIAAGSLEERYFLRGWAVDRILRDKPRKLVEKLWRQTRSRLGSLLDEDKPDVIFSDGIQSLPCYAMFITAAERQIPYLQLIGARLANQRIELHNDVSGRPIGLDLDREPSPATRLWAEQYIKQIHDRSYAGPSYMKQYRGKKISFGRSDVVKGLAYLHELALGGALEPTRGNLLSPFVSKFKARSLAKKLHDSSIYKDLEDVRVRPGQKLLFPLHVTPEASTLTWAPTFSVMGEVVRRLSAQLPEGWTLVVKEHPSVTTLLRAPEETALIRSFPNVILISPYASVYELMDVCDRVVVINSTLGMEAMLGGRSVITLGNPFYDLSENTVPCARVEDLGRKLVEAETRSIDPEKNLRYLCAYYEATAPGIHGNPDLAKKDQQLALMSDENISALAEAVVRQALGRWDELRDAIRLGKIDLGVSK